MKNRFEYIIIGAVIVLLVLYMILHNSSLINYRLPKVGKINPGDITRVNLTISNSIIDIDLTNGSWLIMPENFPADGKKVRSIIETASKLSLVNLASETRNYNVYGLDPLSRIAIKLFSKNRTAGVFYAGKTAATGSHTFVMLENNDNVYLAKGDMGPSLDVSINTLRDKKIFNIDVNVVNSIELSDGHSFKLDIVKEKKTVPVSASNTNMKSVDIWKSVSGQVLNGDKVANIIISLSSLSCDNFLDSSTNSYFSNLTPVYSVDLKSGEDHQLKFFSKTNNEYPAMASGISGVFNISASSVESIIKKPQDLY